MTHVTGVSPVEGLLVGFRSGSGRLTEHRTGQYEWPETCERPYLGVPQLHRLRRIHQRCVVTDTKRRRYISPSSRALVFVQLVA